MDKKGDQRGYEWLKEVSILSFPIEAFKQAWKKYKEEHENGEVKVPERVNDDDLIKKNRVYIDFSKEVVIFTTVTITIFALCCGFCCGRCTRSKEMPVKEEAPAPVEVNL